MRTTEQINSFWDLAREHSVDGEVLRRRAAALGATAIVFCGFLLAIGLGLVVLAFLIGALVSVFAVALVAAWPRIRVLGAVSLRHLRDGGRRVGASAGPRLRSACSFAGEATAAACASTAHATTVVRRHTGRVARTAAGSASRAGGSLGQSARATALRFAPRPARLNPQREAIRLNATGTQHRRHGRYEEAVACHRQALEILRALGDRRGVALTQSNLALALSHAGDDEWAIGLFEEAAATLRDLGDEEHEGQVMANLGLVHRRHGRRQEGDNVLELALAKLSPASSAYQAVEAELRRAS